MEKQVYNSLELVVTSGVDNSKRDQSYYNNVNN